MKITEITVTAGRTFNHPHEQYSNLRPEVTLRASVDDGEDAGSAAKALQAQAEGIVEDHKQGLLKSLDEINQLNVRQQEMADLNRQLVGAQRRLEEIRKEHPVLAGMLTDGPSNLEEVELTRPKKHCCSDDDIPL